MEADKKTLYPQGSAGDQRFIHLALAAWGFSSWILFNGLWGQLPLFIRTLPEGNKLGVLILSAEQLAYIFPLLFMYKKRRFNNDRSVQETDIWLLLLSGLAVSLLLSQYWHAQALLDNHLHSIGLLVLAFLTGAVCSSTGVVFTPYLATLPKSYTSAHTAGAGLSGLAVALLTLAADAGSLHPRLSVERYFNVLSLVFVGSLTAFYYVRRHVHDPAFENAWYREIGNSVSSSTSSSLASSTRVAGAAGAGAAAAAAQQQEEGGVGGGGGGGGYGSMMASSNTQYDDDDQPLIARVVAADNRAAAAAAAAAARTSSSSSSTTHPSSSPPSPPKKESHTAVFILQCLLSALAYGIVPSTLPLACTGYSDPSRILMFSTVGFMCADPLGKLATSFLPTGRIYLSGLVTMLVAGVLLFCAAQSQSPNPPPLAGYAWGGMLVVVANTLFSFSFSFTSISIFFDRRRKEEEEQARKAAVVAAGGGDVGVVGVGGEGEGGKEGGEGAYEWFAWSAFMIQTGAFLGTAVSLVALLAWS